MVIDWQEHCPWIVRFDDPEEFFTAVQLLLSVRTCFISETSDLILYTTDRGADVLNGISRERIV